MIKVEFEPEGHKIEEGEILEGDWSDEAPGGDGDEGPDYEELTAPSTDLNGCGSLKDKYRPGPSNLCSKVITLKLPDPDQRPPAVISTPSATKRIPRPPNAFMLYANTWRRKLANIYPGESNKEISVRLGKLWKSMGQAEKESYFNLAKQVDAEHKMRYPDYVYNPKEARLRKALRDQGRLHRPRQKWKPSSSAIRQSSLSPMMLKQARAEDYRSHTMLQNYNDSFPDLNYPQVHMPPPGDYNLVQPLEQSWYNSYVHGGLQNGGGDFYGRVNDNKSDWNSYSDQESPYVSSQINNNNSAEGSPYSSMQSVPQMMGQQMQMEGQMMINSQDQIMGSAPDPLLISDVHSEMMTNGVEAAPVEPTTPIPAKDEDNLPKLDGPQATLVNSEGPIKEGGKDSLKLPGFHQTFGNITEIGRFSQHDDYFESRPAEVIAQPPKDSSASEDENSQGYILPVSNDGVVSYMWQGVEPSVYIAGPDGPITFYSHNDDSTYYTMEVTSDSLQTTCKDFESEERKEESYLETLSSITEEFKLPDMKVPGSLDLDGEAVILSANENICMVLKTEDRSEQEYE